MDLYVWILDVKLFAALHRNIVRRVLILIWAAELKAVEWVWFADFQLLKTMVFERGEHEVGIARFGGDISLVEDVV